MKTKSRSVTSVKSLASITSTLLAWYDTHRRNLPWRTNTDPYRVWISEIMLQQTRVDAVLPYYERWLNTFPDIDTLANADLHDVLKQWEGLGYYSRARNLHGAARLLRERHGGQIPAEYAQLRALPGIGEYTAGAIASIAYNQQTPAVDGNVRRVMARLFDLANPNHTTIRKLATQLLAKDRPGDFNQAVMDLGATVCTPQKPSCNTCPIAANCLSNIRATTHKRPAPKRKKNIPHFRIAVLIDVRDSRVLLEQRAAAGLLAGLWQFPEIEKSPVNAHMLGEVTHTFSHKRITYVAYASNRRVRPKSNQKWVELSETSTYPMSAAQRKIEKLFVSQGGSRAREY